MLPQVKKIQLRRKAHALHPLVILGQHGLTPAVHAAIDEALKTHELIKIRVNADDKAQRLAFIDDIVSTHQAEIIQTVGHLLVIYRKNDE